MEAWRQRPLGGRTNVVSRNEQRIDLTPTGLLMEGGYTQNPCSRHFECYREFSTSACAGSCLHMTDGRKSLRYHSDTGLPIPRLRTSRRGDFQTHHPVVWPRCRVLRPNWFGLFCP